MRLSFGDLLRIPTLGHKGVLDFCCTLEGAIQIMNRVQSAYFSPPSISATGHLIESDSIHSELIRISNCDWAPLVSKQDPRFSDELEGISGTIFEYINDLIVEMDRPEFLLSANDLIQRFRKIEERAENIRRMNLEDELQDYLSAHLGKRNARLEVFMDRFGWNGKEIVTLETCGEALNITRERVRQIQAKITRHFPDHEIFMPKLDAAVDLLRSRAPCRLDEAANALSDAGISKTPFDIHSLLSALSDCRKYVSLTVTSARGESYLTSSNLTISLAQMGTIARALAGQSGASNIFAVQSQLQEKYGTILDDDVVRHFLKQIKTLDFLDEDWFWATDIPPSRNRLRNTTRQMLAVASPQSISSLREGVRRKYSYRRSSNGSFSTLLLPPASILLKFYEHNKEFVVDGNSISCSVSLDYHEVLGESERVLVDVLRSTPSGVLDRSSFWKQCVERGINENTFGVYTTYSAVIDHVSTDVWKLRGVLVQPPTIEALRAVNSARPKEKRVLSYGWTGDEKLYVAVKIPTVGRSNMVFGCPSPIRSYITVFEFPSVIKGTQTSCGEIRIDQNGTFYGFSRFMRLSGADENDVVLIEFDLVNQTAEISVGGDELLDA